MSSSVPVSSVPLSSTTASVLAARPTATNPPPSPNGGGGGDNVGPGGPGGPGAGTGTGPPQQQAHCPLTPVTPVNPRGGPNNNPVAVESLSVEIKVGAKLPWAQGLTAPTTFTLSGCITQLAAVPGSRNGHVDWWCPAKQPQSPEATLTQGFTLARTHHSGLIPASPDPPLPSFTYPHVRFDARPSSATCAVPDGQLSTSSFHRDCATCPAGKSMADLSYVLDFRFWHLHGCIEADGQRYCSWFQFLMNMPCLGADKVRELAPSAITCEPTGKTGKALTDQAVVGGLLNEGKFDKPPVESGVGSGSADNTSPGSGTGAGATSADAASNEGMSNMTMAALIVVPAFGIAFLVAAAIIYQRRQARFTRRLSDPHEPIRLRRASLTCMPAGAGAALSYAEMSPAPASTPAPTRNSTLVKIPPRVFPNTTLHTFPPAATSPSTSADRNVSLQSLTDTWHSLFLTLEHAATTHARASLPADVPVAQLRTARAEYMAAVMVHVWQVLRGYEATPASAVVADLAEGMRDVLQRTVRVYPGFRLAWPEVERKVSDEVAGVYFEHEGEGAAGAGRVVRAVVFPGWVDEDRGVVVVKARVVV